MIGIGSKASAVIQSLIALSFVAILWFFAIEFQSGIDPREDQSFVQSLLTASAGMAIPLAWSTLAAILTWKRKAIGHWLGGSLDLVLAVAVAVALRDDFRILPTMPSDEGIHAVMGDITIHSVVLILCAVGSFLAIRTKPATVSVTSLQENRS
jgi:Na+/phosphate symporter